MKKFTVKNLLLLIVLATAIQLGSVMQAYANTAPIAGADFVQVRKGTGFVTIPYGTLLVNDTDLDGDPLRILAVNAVNFPGTVVNNVRESAIEITIEDSFSGTVTFTYIISDRQASSLGTITLAVQDVPESAGNIRPVAVDDFIQIQSAGSEFIRNATVLRNDSDLNGDRLTIQSIDGSNFPGQVQRNRARRGIDFVVNAGFSGEAEIGYVVTDGQLTSTGVITIRVAAQSATPTAFPAPNARYKLLNNTLGGGFLTTGTNGRVFTTPTTEDTNGSAFLFEFIAKNDRLYWIVSSQPNRGALDTRSNGGVQWVEERTPNEFDKLWILVPTGEANRYYLRNREPGRTWLAARANGNVFWTNDRSEAAVWFFRQVFGGSNAKGASAGLDKNTIALDAQENSFLETLTLYPNPAREELTIHFLNDASSEIEITMIDMLGKQVLQHRQTAQQEIKLPTERLSDGLYQVIVQHGGEKLTRRILIDKQ